MQITDFINFILDCDQYYIFIIVIFVTILYVYYQNIIAEDVDFLWLVACGVFFFVLIIGFESDTIDVFRPDLMLEYYADYPVIALNNGQASYVEEFRVATNDFFIKNKIPRARKKLFLNTTGLNFKPYYEFYPVYPLKVSDISPFMDRVHYVVAHLWNIIVDFFDYIYTNIHIGSVHHEKISKSPVGFHPYRYRVYKGDNFLYRSFVKFDYSGPTIPKFTRSGVRLPGVIATTSFWVDAEPHPIRTGLGVIDNTLESAIGVQYTNLRPYSFSQYTYRNLETSLKLPYTRHWRRADWLLPLSYDFYLKGLRGAAKQGLVALEPQSSGITERDWKQYFSELLYGKSSFDFYERTGFTYWAEYDPIPEWTRLPRQRVSVRPGFINLEWHQHHRKFYPWNIYVNRPLGLEFVSFLTAETKVDGFFLTSTVNGFNNFNFFRLGVNGIRGIYFLKTSHSVPILFDQLTEIFSQKRRYQNFFFGTSNFFIKGNYYLNIPIKHPYFIYGVQQLDPFLPKLGYIGPDLPDIDTSVTHRGYITVPRRHWTVSKFARVMSFNTDAKEYTRAFLDLPSSLLRRLPGEGEDWVLMAPVMTMSAKLTGLVIITYMFIPLGPLMGSDVEAETMESDEENKTILFLTACFFFYCLQTWGRLLTSSWA